MGCNLSVIAQLLNANPGLPFERTMFIEKEQFLTSVNSTVPAVTLPVAGGTHLHVWLYRAQDRSGGRMWNQNKAL